MKAAIISNGDITKIEELKEQLKGYEFVICADGASNRLRSADIMPDYILGDLDSIEADTLSYFEEKNVKFIRFNPEKDYSDTHICVNFLKEKGIREIDIYGALGGRWDHSMANFGLMYYGYENGISIRLVDEYDRAFICGEGKCVSLKKENQCFSIFAVFEDAQVTLEGVKYPLNEYNLRRGESIGLSNEYIQDCTVEIKKGSAIIIESQVCRKI
ncbi:MAG: thiamine diphosphokinase [Proteocatella sp.]